MVILDEEQFKIILIIKSRLYCVQFHDMPAKSSNEIKRMQYVEGQ